MKDKPCSIPDCKHPAGNSLLCSDHFHKLPASIRNAIRHASGQRLETMIGAAQEFLKVRAVRMKQLALDAAKEPST